MSMPEARPVSAEGSVTDYKLDSNIDNELFDSSIRVNDLVYY